ncbi:hypothetical protein ACU4GR_17325 [Methylobacterium oryzae CBMB20]
MILDRVLDARTADELDRTAKLIAGRVGLAPDGSPTLSREPPDPRFATPYGGLYLAGGGGDARPAVALPLGQELSTWAGPGRARRVRRPSTPSGRMAAA